MEISLRALYSRLMQLHSRVDIDVECDYPKQITVAEYKTMFRREGIGARICGVFPEHCWEDDPIIMEDEDETAETEFESAVAELVDKLSLWSYLESLDVEMGIGRYGILLLGTDDKKDLNLPLTKASEITYLRVYDESCATVAATELDTTNPRYGWPNSYTIAYENNSLSVHHSRVIHVSDRPGEPYGQPRMENVYNRLLDLRKMYGGSAEMLWQAGFSGLSFEPAKLGDDMVYELDSDEIKKAVDAYRSGLARYIAVEGAVAKTLSPTLSDPSPHIESHLKAIALIKGIPYRILLGTEEAQLAGEQDASAWSKRIRRRQNRFVSPFIIKRVLSRLIELGILPEPKQCIVKWPDRESSTDQEKASVGESRSRALSLYVSGGLAQAVPLFEYLTLFLGLDREEAEGIVDKIDEELLLTSGDDFTDPEDPNDPPANKQTIDKKETKSPVGKKPQAPQR